MSDALHRLQDLFASLCDGEWEHGQGVIIESLDNPGWFIRICLSGTRHAALELTDYKIERDEDDWVHVAVQVEGPRKFLECACGPKNLNEAIELVLQRLE